MKKIRAPISVLIVTKNREHLFFRCLRSLLHQKVLPSEVVVIDSSDVRMIIPREIGNALVIRYTHDRRLTIPLARAKAISEATRDYLLFLDDDCELEEYGLKKYLAHITGNHPPDFVMGKLLVSNHQNPYALVQDMFYQIWMMENFTPMPGCQDFRTGMPLHFDSALIKKSAFSGVYFDSKAPALFQDDDVDVGVQLFALGRRMVYDASIVTRYAGRGSLHSLLYRGFATGFSNQYIRKVRSINVCAVMYAVSGVKKISLFLRVQKRLDNHISRLILIAAVVLYILASRIGRMYFYYWRLQRKK